MKVTELIDYLEQNKKLYGDNIEIAIWNDRIDDYVDFYINAVGKRKSKSDWRPELLYIFLHPIITDKKFHYFEYINEEDNKEFSPEELMTPEEKWDKKYNNNEIHSN